MLMEAANHFSTVLIKEHIELGSIYYAVRV